MHKKKIYISFLSCTFVLVFVLSSNIRVIEGFFASATQHHHTKIFVGDFEKEKESSEKDGEIKDEFYFQKAEKKYLAKKINQHHTFTDINWVNLSLPPSIPPPEFQS